MPTLTTNPSEAITADGEYALAKVYPPGTPPVRVEVYGTRGGGSVQIGVLDPTGSFNPLLAAVTSATDPICWEVDPPYSGRIAVKVNGATSPSLKIVSSQARA